MGDETDAAQPNTTQGFRIHKVQISPGKSLAKKHNELLPNYATKLPVLPSKPAEYVPMPYVFRMPAAPTPTKIKNLRSRSPPFHLLLDHTIAVIWLLFAEKEYSCPLGIVQLQWALSFLKTIHTRQGDYPKDVEICIDAIEEILLNQYADLSKDMGAVNRLDDSVAYQDGALGSNNMVTRTLPFSLNYEEMVRKARESEGADATHRTKSITSAEAEVELENIKKAAEVESLEKLDSVSKEKAINVLRMWKNDQVGKIREELRRLRSIEDKMADIDVNFAGYIEDDPGMLLEAD